MENPIKQHKKDNTPLIFAHRGLVTLHQENTLAAIEAAVQSGVCNGCEIDVYLSKDNQVVLFHDEDLLRTTGKQGHICDMTLAEIQSLQIQKCIDVDGGLRHYPCKESIPLLADVLKLIKGKEFILNIELKAHKINWSRRHLGKEVAKLVREFGMEDQVVCVSFDFFMLYALEREHRGICSGYGYDDGMPLKIRTVNRLMEWNFIGRFIHSDCAMVEHTLIDEDSIAKYHQRNMGVGAYTLFPLTAIEDEGKRDDFYANEVRRLADLSVDWITTDYPEKVSVVLNSW